MARNMKPDEPRAFRLDPPAKPSAAVRDDGRREAPDEPAGQAFRTSGKAVITPEAEPAEGAETPRETSGTPGFRWVWALASALGGLAVISLGIWVQDAIINAIRRSDVLGLAAVALSCVIVAAALVISIRFLRDWARERRISKLKASATEALASRSPEKARAAAERLVRLTATRPETAAGRARFAAALPGLTDARDIIALAEREIIEPLDAVAADEIARAARQVSMVTAVSPRALIDIVFVVFAGARLIRRIAAIYGGRPTTLGLWRIARASIEHLLVTGGLAAGHAVIQQVIGQGLAARLSAKLGEGVLNGLMTARFGLAALTVCRPLPFVEAPAPTLGDVASGLLSSSGEKAGQP